MQQFKISIFEGKEASYGQYVTGEPLVDYSSLEQYILLESWSPSIFHEAVGKDGVVRRNRKNSNFASAQVFAIDIDGGLGLVEAIEQIKSLGYQAIIGTTRNHQKEKWNADKTKFQPACDRFRIIFFLNQSIKSDDQYRAVFKTFKNIFPSCDDSCKDPARFFYPCTQIALKNTGRLFAIDTIITKACEPPKHSVIDNLQNPTFKGALSKNTLDFIAHGAPDGKWHDRLIKALYDLKQQGYSIGEATVQIRKASLSASGGLDNKDLEQIKDIYENREVKYPPRLEDVLLAGPQPLFRELPPSLPFPIKSLGSVLGPAVVSLANTSKAPVAMCAQSVLAAATLAVQPFRNVCIDGRIYPVSQFFITIGESGERKSAVDNEALKTHREFQQAQLVFAEMEQRHYINEKEAYEQQRKRILNSKKSKEEMSRELAALGTAPCPPLQQFMLIQEPTFEGLLKLLENGRPSIGLFSDEGGRMLGGHGMNEDNQLKTMAGFCTLWDGKPISRVRVETGSKNIAGKRFSLHLMLQPLVAQQLTGNTLANEQGFLSRCLFTFPESTVGSRMYVETNYNDAKMVNYHNTASRILNTSLPLAANSKNELHPEIIELSTEAKEMWIEFHDYVESNLSEQGLFRSIRGFGSKAAEHALRMAAVLTLVENLKADFIDKNKMQSAIELMRFYLSEALRLFSVSSINPDLIQAEKLLRWCHNQNTMHIHIGQVYKNGPNSLRDKKTAAKIIKILEDHGHLQIVVEGMVLEGAHRSKVWKIIKPILQASNPSAVFAKSANQLNIEPQESRESQQINDEGLT